MFDKPFDSAAVEETSYPAWEESGVFTAHPESDRTPFSIMMPPPNVTGSLHMGHALNMTLQDILTRYNRMNGKDALWMPGTDHAGIATQMVVERRLAADGKNRRDMGRKNFIDEVWKWKAESGGTIVHQLRALGTTPDWTRERFTMDEGMSKAVVKAFVQLHKDGLIYRDKRLVNWDPKFHTAISDIEVEQKEVKGHMWHIRYPIEGDKERFITVATTRPETMLGDTAVAVNPADERYKDLVGRFAILPISGRLIPIVADEYADPEQGSGAVKITPAHDFNDFEVGRRHNLPMINIFDIDARINENGPDEYQGLDRFDARKKVLQELEELDLLVEVEDIKHTVPYGDRSGVVIEPYLTDQWYVDAATMAKPAMEAVRAGKTVFVPKQWETNYFMWMEDIQPWCISRQLWWGHRIPAWFGPDGSIFVAETEEGAYEQARARFGDKVQLTQDEDVLDTWFSSALWPFSTLGWPEKTPELDKYYPGDVLITGFDILFFWVARMMMMGVHFMGEVPFKTVYMHALVRDAKGQKMSKSKGNVIDPLELTQKYGADALRFTLTAMAAQGRDIRLSEDRVEGYRNFTTKLWNAARYQQMNGCKPDASFDPHSVTYVPNKWIVGAVLDAQAAMDKAFSLYRFNDVANSIYQFVWGTFCDWYLEFTKPILQQGGEAAVETQKTTAWVFDQILLLLNPVMPYVTEELYAKLAIRPEGEKLLSSAWPRYDAALKDAGAMEEMDWVIRFISEIRSVRSDMNVPVSAKIRLLVKDANPTTTDRLQRNDEIIRRMARLESIALADEAPRGAIQTIVDEAMLILPIADIIDLDQERTRLRKEIDKLQQNIDKIDQQLGNEKFMANAPDEIIQEQHARRAEAEATLHKFAQALKQLEAA